MKDGSHAVQHRQLPEAVLGAELAHGGAADADLQREGLVETRGTY